MNTILTENEKYLKIFSNTIKIDNNLPKWKKIYEANNSQNLTDEKTNNGTAYNNLFISGSTISLNNNSFGVKNGVAFNNDDNYVYSKDIATMNIEDFNILVSKNVVKNSVESSSLTRFLKDIPDEDAIDIDGLSYTRNDGNEKKSWFDKSMNVVKGYFKEKKKNVKDNFIQINILDFFKDVKLTTNESEKKYEDRLIPYIVAMKQAQDMGQQALVDKLFNSMITAKYETVLYANGFLKKITEEQIVNFVKKAEKGVQLCYVSNFSRPIPSDVFNKKVEADKLMIFDNYCILYYDTEGKVYQMTEEQKKEEYRKKTDPILFGMIAGSNNLYYIADWIDEKCDLTLDEFIRVSKLSEKDIKIDDKIKF